MAINSKRRDKENENEIANTKRALLLNCGYIRGKVESSLFKVVSQNMPK